MTEKQIDRIKLKIKKQRTALVAEKRLYGGFHDGGGRRYYIADLYIQIADYKGAITYKKWFDKNFPDDIGDAMMSLNWSIAYHGLDKFKEAEIFAIDTAFQNIYLHGLLLDRVVDRIDMFEPGYDILDYTESHLKDFKKSVTKSYLDWLSIFMTTDDYKVSVNRHIAISKLLVDEKDHKNRIKLLDNTRELIKLNKNKIK
jgi:hypothetical protein